MKFPSPMLISAASTAVLLALLSGCGRQTAERTSSPKLTPVTASATADPSTDASKYILAAEPDGATSVISARKESQHGEEIVLLGRIGGSKKPWIEGRSAFMVIDASMTVVGDGEESGIGQLCLDDCCASLRTECTTLVKIVDDQGRVLPIDARDLLNVKTGDLVVIRGHVERDEEQGSFVVIADGVHVRR